MASEVIQAVEVRIYALVDPLDGFAKYVGKTTATLRTRLNGHLSDVRRGRVYIPRHRWIQFVLSKGVAPEIIELEVCGSADWQEYEKFWISYLRFLGCPLLNATDGGDGISSHRHSTETKDKQRAAALLRYLNPENKKKTGDAVRQAFLRPEAKENLRRGLSKRVYDADMARGIIAEAKSVEGRARRSQMSSGRKQSEETKKKLSIARKGKKMPAGFSERQSAYRTGKKHKPETIQKMIQTWARKKAEKLK